MRPACLMLLAALAACGCSPKGSPGELVRQMFESPDADVRRSAIEKLVSKDWGRRKPYTEAYAALTADPAATVRSTAVRALGRCGDADQLKAVLAALNDREEMVRWDAAVALDSLIDEQAVKGLTERAALDGSVDVRAAAAKALRHYRRKDVLETLLGCLEDASFCVRYQAAKSLGELTGESAGLEADQWRTVLAAKADPFARQAKRQRPWWDWLGVSKSAPTPATQPAGK